MRRERRHALEAAVAGAAAALVRRLPRRTLLAVGRGLGRLWGALDRRHMRIAAANLRAAFPGWDEAKVAATARGVYAHFGAVILDLLWMEGRTAEELLAIADLEGVEHLQRARAAGKGVVSPSAHLGNWEVQAVASVPRVGDIAVVARPLDNAALDQRLVALRTSTGNTVIYKRNALGEVMRTIRRGGIVAILIDQNMQPRDGIFVRFFGRPACTTTVAAALALKTGCAIVPVRCLLQPSGRYRMVYGPPVEWQRTGRREEDIAALTQHLTSLVEGWVRETPEQWLWLHRRWKTQPGSSPETAVAQGLASSGPTSGSGSGVEVAAEGRLTGSAGSLPGAASTRAPSDLARVTSPRSPSSTLAAEPRGGPEDPS